MPCVVVLPDSVVDRTRGSLAFGRPWPEGGPEAVVGHVSGGLARAMRSATWPAICVPGAWAGAYLPFREEVPHE
jgi:hypothetical protein